MHQVLLLHEGYLYLCSDLFCRSYIAIKLHANENNALSHDKCTNDHESDVNMKNDIKQIENLQVDA